MAMDMVGGEGMATRLPAVGAKASARARVLYIDNLRILLIVLVVLHHLAIAYGASGDWYYDEGEASLATGVLLTLFTAINQAFFMGFFFMLSSYFMVNSYDRKGALPYFGDRLERLGIALLFYFFVINPFINYMLQAYRGTAGSLWDFLSQGYSSSFGVGPLWFVEALLIFSLGYVLWRLVVRPALTSPQTDSRAPGNAAIALFALAIGVITFVVRIWLPVGWWLEPLHLQLAHFPQYIALFVVGIVAYQRNWFARITPGQGKLWLWIAVILVPLVFIVAVIGGALESDVSKFDGGLYWQALFYALWEQFMGLALIVTLLVWFRDRLNHQGRLAGAMSADAYAVYILFAPVTVLLSLAIGGITLDPAIKFVLISPVAVAFSFLVAHAVRSLPLARNIL